MIGHGELTQAVADSTAMIDERGLAKPSDLATQAGLDGRGCLDFAEGRADLLANQLDGMLDRGVPLPQALRGLLAAAVLDGVVTGVRAQRTLEEARDV